MTFLDIKIRKNYTVLVYLLLKVGVGRTCLLGGLALYRGKSAHAWVGLLRVRFGYWLVTVLVFVDSTNVDKIFSFNLRLKLILQLYKYSLQIY